MENIIEIIGEPIKNLLTTLMSAIPGLIYAILILVAGMIFAKILSGGVKKILKKVVKLDQRLKKQGLHDAMGDLSLTNLVSGLLYWWVMLLFLGQASMQINLGMISKILQDFITWTPNLLYAILIMVGGFLLADFLTDRIKKSKNIWADRTAMMLEPTIIFFVALIALSQLGIRTDIVLDLVSILFIAISVGIALAIGLAFGLGMKDETPKLWKNMQKEWNKQR